jgi:GNAT superfamily N-acetyltransferase
MDIQPLEHNDINVLTDLTPDGWQNIVPIFDFYTKSNFCFPIKVVQSNKIIGIGTTIIHNDIAWLAHIIVHPDRRNQGIGQLITQTLVDSVKAKSCDTIHLIATDLGAPVYEKLGFVTETEYIFFKDIRPHQSWAISKNIIPFADNFRKQVESLDHYVSLENRMLQVEQHLKNGFVYLQNNNVEGYYLPTFGEGLIVADTASAGVELIKLRLTSKENAAFPIDNSNAAGFFHQHNFKEFKTAKRMRLGQKKNWQPTKIYNRIGGNFG